MNKIERVNKKYPAYWILEAFFLCFSVVSLLLISQYALAGQGESQVFQQEVSKSIVTEQKKRPVQREEAVIIERAPAGPEHALIYDFVDWTVHLLSSAMEDQGIILETDPNYSITGAGNSYEVRLELFLLHIGDHLIINVSPVIFTCSPQGTDKLGVQMHLPRKLPIISSGKVTSEITIKNQQISGVWDRGMESFDHTDLQLDELLLKDTDSDGQLSVQQLILGSILSHDTKGGWQERIQGSLKGASLIDNDLNLAVGSIGLLYELRGSNFETYKEIKKKYLMMADAFEEMELSESKEFFAMADSYLQLLTSSETRVTIDGVVADVGDTIRMDGMEFSWLLQKDARSNKFQMNGKGEVRGFSFVEQASEDNLQALSISLQQIAMSDSVELNPIPPTLFADLYTALEKVETLEDEEEIDNYLAGEGLHFAKKILALIAGSSADISLSDVTINNLMDHPLTLEAVTFGGGFDAGTGTGGTVTVRAGFSGFKGMAQGNKSIPQAARLNFTLANIPSLLNLISDPSGLAEGDMDQVQGQVMMNGMSAFLTSPLSFSLTDSFVSFPTSRLNLDLTANIDNAAKFLFTGSMKLVMENPDEFMQIAKTFGADENILQLLTTISSLANRSDENGKVVDRLNAEVNQEGKVFANNKDVTLMFFPEQADNGEGQEADSGEAQSPAQDN